MLTVQTFAIFQMFYYEKKKKKRESDTKRLTFCVPTRIILMKKLQKAGLQKQEQTWENGVKTDIGKLEQSIKVIFHFVLVKIQWVTFINWEYECQLQVKCPYSNMCCLVLGYFISDFSFCYELRS